VAGLVLTACSAARLNLPGAYKGWPFEDNHSLAGAQVIPGRVQAAYFDLGGEGVAYHNKGNNLAWFDFILEDAIKPTSSK